MARIRGKSIVFEVNGTEDVSNIMDVGALIAKATGEMAPQVALSYLAGGGLLAGAPEEWQQEGVEFMAGSRARRRRRSNPT